MEGGFALYKLCLKPGIYREYCTEIAGPDVCTCGQVIAWTGYNLRQHCQRCQGKRNWKPGYEIQRIERELDIHRSWIEFGFASAVGLLRDVFNSRD